MKERYLAQTRLLLDVLPIIRDYPDFALKGGTALNYFLHDLPRLSVDIDLQYLPVTPYQKARFEIHRQMEAMCADVQRALVGARCHYDPAHFRIPIRHQHADIKIETNDVIRGQVFEPSIRPLASKLEERFGLTLEINCLNRADLYAGKLTAALDRQHPRDLFDIHLLLEESKTFDRQIIEAFVVYLVGSKKSIRELLDPNLKEIGEPYARKFQGMAAIDIEVEALQQLQARLPGLVRASLTDSDKQFLLGFKRGMPDWNLLPLGHVKDLPAVRWKMHNLDRMAEENRRTAVEKLEQLLNRPPEGMMSSNEQTTPEEPQSPSAQLAEEITLALIEAGVIDETRKHKLVQGIVEGKLDPDQWALWVDLSGDSVDIPDAGENANAQ